MKNMKKIVALLLATVMVMAMSISVFAAGTGTITITPPTGTENGTTNTYKIYKVFDADGDGTHMSYKLVSGKNTAPAGFSVDSAGNVTLTRTTGDLTQLTADEISAIASYVTEADLVATATSTGTANAVSEALPNGYYYITTSTGSVVTINSTNPNATVIDKNTVPEVDKTITGASTLDEDGKKATAEVGTTVNYSATITVGKGAKNYKFHDKMSAGLTYNNDAAVTGIDANQYEILDTPEGEDTITITFVDGIAEGTEITITYSATVNSDALTTDPANNTATISYGDNSGNTSTPSTTEVYNAQVSVVKNDGKGTETTEDDTPLAGAGFVLKNGAGKYYKLENNDVTWVDAIGDATEHVSNAQGQVAAFTGLAAGDYILEEKTVPAGFNKAADVSVTIAENDYTEANLVQSKTIANNQGSVLPSTGGIGTTMFYVVGSVLVIGAAVVLISKRRMAR